MEYFLRAKEIDERLKNERLLADEYNYLGLCYENLRQNSEARLCFQKALEYFGKFSITQSMSSVLYNIGFYFYNRKNYDSAITYFGKSYEVIKYTQENDMKLSAIGALAET